MKNESKEVVYTFDRCDKSAFVEFGDKLREIRNSRGVSQHILGEKTNRDRTGLSGYERGVKTPSINGLYEIASALGYKFKISFEDKEEGTEMKCKREIFSEKFVNQFMEDMLIEGTYENLCLKAGGFRKSEKWCIDYKDNNKVTFKSNADGEITLTCNESTENRYVTINLDISNSESVRFEMHRDLDEIYSLGDMILSILIIDIY